MTRKLVGNSTVTVISPIRVEMRRRVCRILQGEYRSDDFDQIFLFLRGVNRDRQTLAEIGDFVAHREERNKGILTTRLREWYHTCQFQVPFYLMFNGRKELSFDILDNLPHGLPAFLKSNMDMVIRRGLLRESGLSVRLAKDAFARLSRRIREKEDGTSSLIPHGDYEHKLLSILLGTTDCNEAFTLDAAFAELSDTLRSQSLLDKTELDVFSRCKMSLGFFIVSRMHQCTIAVDNRKKSCLTATFAPDGESRKINVMAEAPGADTKISVAFPVFTVYITDPTLVAERLAKMSYTDRWTFPVELSLRGGLDVLA